MTARTRRQRSLGPWDPRSPTPRRRHGLSPTEVEALLRSQGFGCALCGSRDPGDVSFALDHDHRHCAGTFGCRLCVRSALCRTCNLTLGYAKDDPALLRRMAEYLERWEAVKPW